MNNRYRNVDRIPDIQALREDITKWSRVRCSQGPNKAAHALREMFRYYKPKQWNTKNICLKHQGQHIQQVGVIDCNQVINAWGKSQCEDATNQVVAILEGMTEAYIVRNNTNIRPDVITYNSVINAFARRGDLDGAKKVFNMQLDDYKNKNNMRGKPNIRTFNTMIHACSKCNREDIPEVAEKMLTIINTWHDRKELEEPDIFTYNGVINCWSKSNRPEAPHHAHVILQTMISKFKENGNINIRPNVITYSSVIDAYARQGDIDGARNVFEIMENDFDSGNIDAKPNIFTYNILIRACFKSDNPNAPEEAESLLMETIELHSTGKLVEGPDVISYRTVIDCWSKSSKPKAPIRALNILVTMIKKSKQDNNKNIRPDAVTYSAVMSAFARRGDIDSAKKVFTIMKNDFNSGNINAKPSIRTYSVLIYAWSKSDKPNAPEEADLLLREILDLYSTQELEEGPDAITYIAVIDCWSKSNKPIAPRRALNILTKMTTKYKEDNKKNIRPDTITYSAVMDAYARQGDIDGARKVLNIMKEEYSSGNVDAKPNIRTYNILIDAWSKSNHSNAPEEAESLLLEMIDLYTRRKLEEGPNTITYSAVINCWSKSNKPIAPSRALNILMTMTTKFKEENNKNIRPNSITYTSVMDAYARQGDIDGARKVFNIMKEDYSSGNIDAKPDIRTYNILIDSWSKSGNENAPDEAEKILSEMHESYKKGEIIGKPNQIIYSTMIKCLKNYQGTEKRIHELKNLKNSIT